MEEKVENGLEIPVESLSADALDGLIQAFILQEGTDYGAEEAGFATKVEQVKRQLRRGDARILFDATEESCAIVRHETGRSRHKPL